MSLTWFPFELDSYTDDTAHLTCEEHGAYLQLMLAYYRSEKPLPARDRSLAATCKLSMDAWMEAKEALAPFFNERDGFWHHDKIDTTIRESNERIANTLKNARAGAEKRWRGHKNKNALGIAGGTASGDPPGNAGGIASGDALTNAHLHLQEDSLSTREREVDLVGVEEPKEPPAPASGIGSPVNPAFMPMEDWITETIEAGFTRQEILEQVKLWIAHKQEAGSFSADWDASWVKGWNSYKLWKAKQKSPRKEAKPRVEVNNTPSEKDFDFGLKMIATGGTWPRYLGPAPGLTGCLCPVALMEKWKIDPVTGLQVRP